MQCSAFFIWLKSLVDVCGGMSNVRLFCWVLGFVCWFVWFLVLGFVWGLVFFFASVYLE